MRLRKSNLMILQIKPRKTELRFDSVNYPINRIDRIDRESIGITELIGGWTELICNSIFASKKNSINSPINSKIGKKTQFKTHFMPTHFMPNC